MNFRTNLITDDAQFVFNEIDESRKRTHRKIFSTRQ
jgi:hypothetical protein